MDDQSSLRPYYQTQYYALHAKYGRSEERTNNTQLMANDRTGIESKLVSLALKLVGGSPNTNQHGGSCNAIDRNAALDTLNEVIAKRCKSK